MRPKSANVSAQSGPMTGRARVFATANRSIVARISTNWKIPAKPDGFTATNAGAFRSCAAIKPKYLPNRAGDCRFLD
jgi:hypothetical protein